jgi:uncharacterized cupredoxin-like copper-binding protein
MNKGKLINILIFFTLGLASCSIEVEAKAVSLIAEDIVWNQSLIEAQVGQEVQVTIRNDGALDHSFVIDELDINVHLSPGEIDNFSFVLNEAGNYDFICGIPGHEEVGMVGEIVISE